MKNSDSMSYKELKCKFEAEDNFRFKLYSLEYNVEVIDNKVEKYIIIYLKNLSIITLYIINHY